MSATGAWAVPTRAFEASIGQLDEWRRSLVESLVGFRRWAVVSRLINEQTAARLAHLERRLGSERLTIAFVAEYSRGKSELINALFFADMGARLLPSREGRTTLCPTEIRWEASRAPSIRLLSVETRESPMALREHLADTSSWKEVALDNTSPEALATAFEVLTEALSVTAAEATRLGYAAEGDGHFEVPRWRYAIVNFPHPLLERGLAILDTPGFAALSAEPELLLHRVPEAAAIVYMLAVDTGATAADQALWVEHIAPIDGLQQTCFVVLNKIDELRGPSKTETQVLSEIDRQVRVTAEALGLDPTRIFALSARQGLTAKMQGDRDALLKSRIYRLEQALAKGMVHQRRVDHATAVLAEIRTLFTETRAVIDSRLAFTREQLDELAALQGKNQKLVDSLARKATEERARFEKARALLSGLKTIHARQAEELGELLDPAEARAMGIRARAGVLGTRFSSGIPGVIDAYFEQSRDRIQRAIKVIAEAEAAMNGAALALTRQYGIAVEPVVAFGTERFLVELQRLEERCDAEFKSTSALILRGRKTLAALFFDMVAIKVIHVFEIADREVRTWMQGFIRPLDAQLTAFQEQTNNRIEGMGRIQNAETDLVQRLGELEALANDVKAQRKAWEIHRGKLVELLAVDREHSLA